MHMVGKNVFSTLCHCGNVVLLIYSVVLRPQCQYLLFTKLNEVSNGTQLVPKAEQSAHLSNRAITNLRSRFPARRVSNSRVKY